jgi:hypothetical protein
LGEPRTWQAFWNTVELSVVRCIRCRCVFYN